MSGDELIAVLCTHSGLPPELFRRELGKLLSQAGLSAENVTLDQLRPVIAELVQDVLVELHSGLRQEQEEPEPAL